MSNKTLKLALAQLVIVFTLKAQMTFFTTPNYKFNSSTNIPQGTALFSGGTQGTYQVANGCYDANNNLLFYATDQGIYNPNGSFNGALGYPGYDSYYNGKRYVYNYFSTPVFTEFAIAPVPGTCKQYYVFYNMAAFSNGIAKNCYIKVDCSGASPVIIYNGTTSAPYLPTANAAFGTGIITTTGNNIGMAISKIVSGSDATAIRYLYTVSGSPTSGVNCLAISASGVSSPTPMPFSIGSINPSGYNPSEVELSPDGNWLAWNDFSSTPGNGKVFVGKLVPLGNSFSTTQWATNIVTNLAYFGLEFTAGTNPLLYLSGTNGLSYISTASQSQPSSISSGTYDLTHTFLEMGINGRIYGVSNQSSRNLVVINPVNNSLGAATVSFDSRITNVWLTALYNQNVFTLPDQIDGENYSLFNGLTLTKVTGLSLNGNPFTGSCGEGGLPQVYSCNPITISASYLNNYTTGTSYQVMLNSNSSSSCLNLIGSTYLNYTGAWVNGPLPNNFDLKALTDGNGNSLNNISGQFMITVNVKDACGNLSSVSADFIVFAPVNPIVDLEIYNTYYTNPANTYVAAQQNISAAVPTGALTAGIRISGSTGSVTGYNITIDQVNSTGGLIKNIYNTTYTTNNISAVGPIALNSLCVANTVWSPVTPSGGACTNTSPSYSGYTGYFGYNNGALSLGNYYKITTTLSNPCSSASNYSYVYVNNGYARFANINENNIMANNVQVYPNPATNAVNFKINIENEGVYSIYLYDVTGKKIATALENKILSAGVQTIELNTAELNAGCYTYKINSNTASKAGILSIVK